MEKFIRYFLTGRFKYHHVSLSIMEIKTKPRKWGNSLAVILPKIIVEANKLKENQEITIEIKNKKTARDIFGIFPRKKEKNAQKIKDEMKKGW